MWNFSKFWNLWNQICDFIEEVKFKEGSEIIKQGEVGKDFFIVLENKCRADKVPESGKGVNTIKEFQPNDYFFESALFKSEENIATVIAEGDCRLLKINGMAMRRLLGPFENILNIKYEVYVKFMRK